MVHLHARSCYSLLQSSLKLEEYIDACVRMGYRHVCLTDHNVMIATMKFWHLCKEKNIHPIIGIEVDVTWNDDPFHFILIAKDDLGLQDLYRLSTNIDNVNTIDDLVGYANNCVVLNSGDNDTVESYLYRRDVVALKNYVDHCKGCFDDFYLSIAKNDSNLHKERNYLLKQFDVPTVALSRILYLRSQDKELLKVLRAIDKKASKDDNNLGVDIGRYLRTKDEMNALYDEDDLNNTEVIAAKCNVQMAFKKAELPVYQNKYGMSSEKFLISICKAGLKKRLNGAYDPVYEKRLNYELDVIIKMGYTDYFLIVYDIILYSRQHDIFVGPGRGSAAGSLVSYCLGITHIDPIQNNLLFERFLNTERVSMPDIDIDFPDDRRDEVIDHIRQKYGDQHVCRVLTLSTLKSKQVIRDVGKVCSIHDHTINELCKLIPNNINLRDAYQINSFRRMINSNKQLQELYDISLRLEGLPRHMSLHAAGIILSNQEIVKVCPMIMVDDQLTTQFTKDYLEELGLIKIDLLAIRNLTIIHEIVTALNKKGIVLDMFHLDLHDNKTYDLLSKGQTAGIFQLEKPGITELLKRTRPNCFADISMVLALYRPGAMQHIDEFIEYRRDHSKIRYLHPLLEPILKETYGIMIYQEQVMQTAQVIASFTLSQADDLRRAMSKKNPEIMARYKDQFIIGANKNNIKTKVANEIFMLMEKFAGYGFNKSHSYAYGYVSYQMAYLKANYPLYFYQSLLNSTIGNDTKTYQFIRECRNENIKVLPVDINRSNNAYQIEDGKLRMPLNVLKGIGNKIYPLIIENAPYDDFLIFLGACHKHKIKTDIVETLIDGGAFDSFGLNRMTLHENLNRMTNYVNVAIDETSDKIEFETYVSKPLIKKVNEDIMIKAQRELNVYGFYLSEHPIITLRQEHYPNCLSITNALNRNGSLQVLGKISSIRNHQAKNGPMCFLTLEDEAAKIDIVVLPNLYEKVNKRLKKGQICIIYGNRDRKNTLLAKKIEWVENN